MAQRTLRQKPRISYYEPEEPDLDEYVFCEKCGDYVYEYCSIHGPLLVIPDDKVPANPNVPPYVPRAALTIPHVFLHIAYSIIPDAGLGVYTSMALPSGVRFGPYRGERTDVVNSSYCWQIYNKDRKPLHCIDAGDANKSNWMRYVNCARHWREQNLVAYQYQGELYYRTIKIIPRFTELMVFYGSEFACELDVDLGKYNSPIGYAQKFGAPVVKKRKQNNTETQNEEIKTVCTNGRATTVSTSNQVICRSSMNDNITNETQNIQVLAESGSMQIQVTCNNTTKAAVTKAEKTKIKNNKKNKNFKATKHNRITENIKATDENINKAQLNKTSISHNIDNQESDENNDTKMKVESKTGTGTTILHDLYLYCDDCNKRCVTKQELQKHLRFHDPNRKYACETCKLRYAALHTLNGHINRCHTKLYTFACEICNKSFSDKSDLKTHMRTHTGEKPHACSVCNKSFSENCNLKIHMRTHTGEKPHACSVCNKSFSQKSYIKTHMRTHTGEKPHACDICDKAFSRNDVLKNHILRIHSGTL